MSARLCQLARFHWRSPTVSLGRNTAKGSTSLDGNFPAAAQRSMSCPSGVVEVLYRQRRALRSER